MNIKLIYFILVLFFVTAASASFSSDNDKIGIEQILSNDLAKDMSIKVDPFLAAEMREKPDEKIPVLIELKEQQKAPFDASKAKSLAIESQSALAASLESIQVENVKQHWIVNVISAKVAAQSIDGIAARPDVKKVWLDRDIKLIEPVSALSASDYGDEQIGAPQVWDIGYNGTGIKIAILDTGINDTHPDLDEGKVVAENDFTDDLTTDDLDGHGTHCAGIAAGERNTSTNITGVAPGASLINAKVLDQTGSGYTSWIISGIEWSMDQDADILSISIGNFQQDGTGRDLKSMAVTNAVNAGYVVVIAAGNEGPGEGTIGSPAVAYGAIAVAASDSSDVIASFSSRGPTGDGRVGIDVAAPGVGINSTNAGWETGEDYIVLSGTSMACPHVAGAAALLLHAYPDLTPEELERALMNAADDLGYEILEQGAGRLNVTAAYLALTNGTLVDDPQWFVGGVYQGNYTNTFTVYNNNGSAVTVSITNSSDDAGDWITLNPSSLSVSANGNATFDATMNVTTTIPGTYNGSITVSDGWSDIIIPVSVNVMQTVDNNTIDYIEGYVDEDFVYDTPSDYFGGDFVYYTLDVQAGITNLNLSLNWTDPSNDLDFILFNPNGEVTGVSETENVPEVISIDNPSTGNWTVAINAWNLTTTPETYNLTINATGENIGDIIDFTVTPEDVERYDMLTFEVNFTNTGTEPITANGTLDIYHIGEYGRVWVDELILSSQSANAGESINWTMEWTASLMMGNYEATARLYYDKTVTEKTEPFNITDTTPPVITGATANPPEIEANGTDNTLLNVTATDLRGIASVTVNLSAIGGPPAQAMTNNSGVWQFTTNTITVGLFELPVNVTDNAGNSNTSVNISLKAVDTTPPIIISATANPSEIEANGTDNTLLNVTATDLRGIASVSVNLSAIGGLPDQAMTNNTGVWQFLTNTTTVGIFKLPVNVTDNAGNSNTSVNISLNATDTTSPVVIDTSPENMATDVKIDSSITATFGEPMNSSTLNDTTVKVYKLATGKITGETFENVNGTWNSSNFQGFSHTEELKIEQAPIDDTHRTIVEGNLTYSTRTVPRYYQLYIGEGIEVEGSENYSVIGWFGNEYIAVNGKPDKLTNLVFEQKTADTKTLQVGKTWDLGDGYSLKLREIDNTITKAWIELYNSSGFIDDFVIENQSSYWMKDDIANENYVPFFVTYLNKVNSTAIELKYTWLISQDATVIETDDSFGVFEVTSIYSDAIQLTNMDSVSLTRGSTIPLVDNLMFEVEDNSIVRYCLVGIVKTALEGDISYDSASRTVTFDPVSNLMYSTSYISYITTGVEDLAGNGLSEDYMWKFKTIIEPPLISVPLANEIFYLPQNTTFVNGTTTIGTNVSVYVNGILVNESYPVIDGMFNVSDVPLVNGTNTINVTAIYNDTVQDHFSANTTVAVSVGGIFNVSAADNITIKVPGFPSGIALPTIDFNVTGQVADKPDNISTAVVVAAPAPLGSNVTGPAIDFSIPGNDSYIFDRPISLTLGFDADLVVNFNKTVVAWYDDSSSVWVSVKSTVNTTANTTTANVTHFTVFAPLEDNTPPANIDLTDPECTTNSITLSWVNSSDTDHVEIWRNEAHITSVTSVTYTDSRLSPGTSYNYGLRPVDIVGNKGNWSNITAKTKTPPSNGGGGGGGGGSSGEPYENIEFKDAARVYVSRDAQISFAFDEPENDIQYVNYRALTSAGYISTVIEILKNTSTFAKEAPPGMIYKNINIWIGTSGYATEANIEDPVVGFKVEKNWIEDNNIEESSIKLNRYHGDTWNALSTAKTDEDSTHLYFESQTPGFSPFAITGQKKTLVAPTPAAPLEEPTPAITPAPEVEAPPEPTPIGKYLLTGAVVLLIIAGAYLYMRKRQS